MAINATLLTKGTAPASGTTTSENTASISPAGNALILACVTDFVDNGGASNITATGNGLTWVQVATVQTTNDANFRIRATILRAMGASPSSGAVTFNFSTATFSVTWQIIQVTGVDTSGTNGSGAVVQSITNTATSAASITMTLPSSFGDATNNAAFGFSVNSGNTSSQTAGSGFTLIDQNLKSQNDGTEWRIGEDLTVDMSWAASNLTNAGIALEIKASTAATSGGTYYQQYYRNVVLAMKRFVCGLLPIGFPRFA